MGIGKTLLIIIVILFVIWYIAPTEFRAGRDRLSEWFNSETTQDTIQASTQTLKDKILNNENVNNTIIYIQNNSQEIIPEEVEYIYHCSLPNKGLPDYYGTAKEGEDCIDNGGDIACFQNPPIIFDGWINLIQKESSPMLYCCETDGMCHWE